MFYFRNFGLLGYIWGSLFCIPYSFSIYLTLRALYMTSHTDPGVIPPVRSKQIKYNKTYRVSYKSADEVVNDNNLPNNNNNSGHHLNI